MFFVLLLAATGLLVTNTTLNKRVSAALALTLVLLAPCWIYTDIGAIRIDLRMGVALVFLAGLALHPSTSYHLRFTAADFVIVALIAAQITSEFLTSATAVSVMPDIILQWGAPYLFGRIVWRSTEDQSRNFSAIVTVCVVLSVWAAIESVTRMNPVGKLLGFDGSIQAMNDIRWGLRRAEGNLTHPIFFGLQLAMLFPFAMAAARQSREGHGPAWWRYAPWIVGAGTFFTMSRGPQLAILLTLAVAYAVRFPRYRRAVLVPLVCAIGLVGLNINRAVELLQVWSGEDSSMLLVIKGEPVHYTGTSHRLLQLRVYEEAVANAGWFGYGSVALAATGVKIPYIEEHLRQMFFSIDNHYLQFVLQTGYVGITLFLLLCLTSAYTAATSAVGGTENRGYFGAYFAAMFVAVAVLVFTVWLASDYRFVLLVMFGISASLPRRRPAETKQPALVPTVPLHLTPGHPSLSLTR
ncbi:MAG: hypothetical protein C0483_07890 [Pirellula sp.]|nr:hypothetical protein [Pirellula sp.]